MNAGRKYCMMLVNDKEEKPSSCASPWWTVEKETREGLRLMDLLLRLSWCDKMNVQTAHIMIMVNWWNINNVICDINSAKTKYDWNFFLDLLHHLGGLNDTELWCIFAFCTFMYYAWVYASVYVNILFLCVYARLNWFFPQSLQPLPVLCFHPVRQ